MNAVLIFAFGWLAGLMLAVHANVPMPDGFGPAIFALTIWSLGCLYYRLCRRWPIAGWLTLGFFVGLFGASSTSASSVVEYDDSDCVDRDNYDNCDNCDNCDGN